MEFVVVSPSAYRFIEQVMRWAGDRKVLLTPLGVSFGLRNSMESYIDQALDSGAIVRAYAHKVNRIAKLPIHESEAVLLAEDFKVELAASSQEVVDEAKRRGVKVTVFPLNEIVQE